MLQPSWARPQQMYVGVLVVGNILCRCCSSCMGTKLFQGQVIASLFFPEHLGALVQASDSCSEPWLSADTNDQTFVQHGLGLRKSHETKPGMRWQFLHCVSCLGMWRRTRQRCGVLWLGNLGSVFRLQPHLGARIRDLSCIAHRCRTDVHGVSRPSGSGASWKNISHTCTWVCLQLRRCCESF